MTYDFDTQMVDGDNNTIYDCSDPEHDLVSETPLEIVVVL